MDESVHQGSLTHPLLPHYHYIAGHPLLFEYVSHIIEAAQIVTIISPAGPSITIPSDKLKMVSDEGMERDNRKNLVE